MYLAYYDNLYTGCSFTDLTPTDAVKQCANIPNGVVCYSRNTAGSEAVYICDDGFHQDGAATRVCQSDGAWNSSTPRCLTVPGGQDGIMSSMSVQGQTIAHSLEHSKCQILLWSV